jgi:hypothetical protein
MLKKRNEFKGVPVPLQELVRKSTPGLRRLKKTMKKIINWGTTFILVGALMAITALHIETIGGAKPSVWEKTGLEFLLDIGLAFISIGIIGIILGFKDWKRYFQERLAETIVGKDYLNTLSDGELTELQTATLKAFFKAEDIDREGSFLHSFLTRIQKLIGSPFRGCKANTSSNAIVS